VKISASAKPLEGQRLDGHYHLGAFIKPETLIGEKKPQNRRQDQN
jgi:hypothetical protein